MKIRFIHPLWTHTPAALLIILAVAFTVLAMPLPDSAPVHFDIEGKANGYGSPLVNSLLLLGFSLGFLLLSAWLDELWARQEKKKAFNWISLFDELAIGDMCGIQIAYMNMLKSGSQVFHFPWVEVSIVCGAAVSLAVLLELLRPYRHYEKVYRAEDNARVQEDVGQLLASGKPFYYTESQAPAYAGVLAVVATLAMFTGAFVAWQALPWLSVLLAVLGLGFVITYGGLRFAVNAENVSVKLGVLGVRLLQVAMTDIRTVELHSFSALQDFGGYGIRYGGGIQAYFLTGDRGVLLTTAEGKKYLLGSDSPARLAAVIDAARHGGIRKA